MIIHSYYNRTALERESVQSQSALAGKSAHDPMALPRKCTCTNGFMRKDRAMSNEEMNNILAQLSQPFHPSRITWRPGALTGKKDKALALAYADLRAYQNRLDETCGMNWSVSYTPWAERIICHLTINGITRSSTGEPDSDSERSEIAGTTAEAQAFKRACAMFGLGRYLYNLPTVWVEYDAEQQRFTEKAKARLHGIITQHYQRFLDGQAPPNLEGAMEEMPAEEAEPQPEPQTEKQPAEQPKLQPERPADAKEESGDAALLPLRQRLDALGQELYGAQWEHVRAHNIKRLIGEQDNGNGALSQAQIQTLINGLKKLKQQRQAV